MNKKHFLLYFKRKEKASDVISEEVTITNIVASATEDVSIAELTLVEEEIKIILQSSQKYQKQVPENIKIEVGRFASSFGTALAIKKFSLKYRKYTFKGAPTPFS